MQPTGRRQKADEAAWSHVAFGVPEPGPPFPGESSRSSQRGTPRPPKAVDGTHARSGSVGWARVGGEREAEVRKKRIKRNKPWRPGGRRGVEDPTARQGDGFHECTN